MEQWCIDGQIFYINKLTGNKFKKGRLSKPTKKVIKDKKKGRETTTTSEPSTTTSSTTTSTTTTTTTTTASTTIRSIRRSSTTSLPLKSDFDYQDENNFDDNEFHLSDVNKGVSVDYVNTVLEGYIPNVKVTLKKSKDEKQDYVKNLQVLQCWSQFSICFIQVVSDVKY